MKTRRDFLKSTGCLALGALLVPQFSHAAVGAAKVKNVGIQLYTVRNEMLKDATATLKQLAKIGYTELESARSEKGLYYGLQPKEIKKLTNDLGMNLRSGHVHIDENWDQTVAAAVETGQEYLICSSLPSEGQTISNYKHTADIFTKAAEDCQKAGIIFGYHNHEYEFEEVDGQVLYDVLLENTDPELVKMEMDLGWVIVAGKDPMDYFERYPGRFPLWHLKDMDKNEMESTEFGKGQVNIKQLLKNADKAQMKYFFVEQEEYAGDPMDSVKHNYQYLQNLKL